MRDESDNPTTQMSGQDDTFHSIPNTVFSISLTELSLQKEQPGDGVLLLGIDEISSSEAKRNY